MPIQHYTGGCQCGAVHYEVDVDLDSTVTCNCSRCQKVASVLAFTEEDKFRLLQGEENLTEYLFNTHRIHHYFCKTCGVQSFSRGSPPNLDKHFVAVNANCLDGINPRDLKSKQYNGRDV